MKSKTQKTLAAIAIKGMFALSVYMMVTLENERIESLRTLAVMICCCSTLLSHVFLTKTA